MIFTVGRRMSVVEEKKKQCKVKNSRIKRRLTGKYIFIKCFSLNSLSYSFIFCAYK
jgi:hypothetical protein